MCFVDFATLSPGENSLKETVGQHGAHEYENDNPLHGSALIEGGV